VTGSDLGGGEAQPSMRPVETTAPPGLSDPGTPQVALEPAASDRRAQPMAFDRFYEVSYPAMVRLARVLVDSPHTAEDLVQDAFVRVHGRWGVVRDPEPYLRRCVVNACRSHYRRLGRERRHAPVPSPSDDGHRHDPLGGSTSLPPQIGARSEARTDDADQLAGALATLPYRQRAAVVLRYYADLPDAQIAAALGCREGTVASLVHRALGRLREVVRDDG